MVDPSPQKSWGVLLVIVILGILIFSLFHFHVDLGHLGDVSPTISVGISTVFYSFSGFHIIECGAAREVHFSTAISIAHLFNFTGLRIGS